ncbi:hypothetical protein BGZ76_006408, partial [Entomortierella beljakovae]
MKEPTLSKVTENMGTDRLCQIRTKFDQLDTYELCRYSGPLTNTSLHQPVTIFTFANQTNAQSSGLSAGYIFNRIGRSVIIDGENAVLTRKNITKALKSCKANGVIYDSITNIQKLFGANDEID